MTIEEAIEELRSQGHTVLRRRWAMGDTIGVMIPPKTIGVGLDPIEAWAGVIYLYKIDDCWRVEDCWLPGLRTTTLAGAVTFVSFVLKRNRELNAIVMDAMARRAAERKALLRKPDL